MYRPDFLYQVLLKLEIPFLAFSVHLFVCFFVVLAFFICYALRSCFLFSFFSHALSLSVYETLFYESQEQLITHTHTLEYEETEKDLRGFCSFTTQNPHSSLNHNPPSQPPSFCGLVPSSSPFTFFPPVLFFHPSFSSPHLVMMISSQSCYSSTVHLLTFISFSPDIFNFLFCLNCK